MSTEPNRSIITAESDGVGRRMAGGLAKYGGNVNAFRAASPLPRDAQILFDDAMIRVGRSRLTLVEDMIAAGMTYQLPNWFSVPVLAWKAINEVGSARRTMVPKARGEVSLGDLSERFLPIYCTWGDWKIDARTLAAAERGGYQIDTAHAEQITRRVNEAIEDQAFNGADLQVTTADGAHTAPGFLNNPLNTFIYTGGEAWDVAGHTGEEILADVMSGIDVLQADKFYGPYRLYVPPTYYSKLGADYKSATSGSILERLQALGMVEVRVAEQLPTNKTLLLQMTSDVADVVIGQTPTMISWSDENDWERFFVVMAAMVVRVKQSYTNQQGWAVGFTS
jgi:uncharacterized linocin/CFP29 family protein